MRKMNKADRFIALRFKDFRQFLLMRFLFTFSFQMQTVILGFYVYFLTKDTLALGFLGLAEAIPGIGLALVGGLLADKNEKKLLLMKVLLGFIGSSVLIAWVTLNPLNITLRNQMTVIYTAVFISGIARGFIRPATFSLMAKMIPQTHYANSSSWYNSSYQLASVAGPALGGLIYSAFGVTVTFCVIITCLIGSLICVLFLPAYPPDFLIKESFRKSIKDGLKFVLKNKLMLNAMALDFISVFFGGVIALLPVFASDILHVGPRGLGIMRAAESIGAILTLFILTKYPPVNKPWRNLLVAVGGFGITIVLFGLSKVFFLSICCLFFMGAFDSVSVLIRSTIMQFLTPDHMRGRVSAINSIFIGSSNEIGTFESGLSAKIMTPVPAAIFGGAMTVLVVFLTYANTGQLLKKSMEDITPVTD